jgi:hypothetical protein
VEQEVKDVEKRAERTKEKNFLKKRSYGKIYKRWKKL